MSVGPWTPPAGHSAWSTSSRAARRTGPSCVALWREGFLLDTGKCVEKVSAWKKMETEKHKVDMLWLTVLPNRKISAKAVRL